MAREVRLLLNASDQKPARLWRLRSPTPREFLSFTSR